MAESLIIKYQQIHREVAQKKIMVLCACDLLNEGWDCPETEVLFMARPTMSKVLYTQQLGRGMRLSKGKDHLMVFDFVDNASQYNTRECRKRFQSADIMQLFIYCTETVFGRTSPLRWNAYDLMNTSIERAAMPESSASI